MDTNYLDGVFHTAATTREWINGFQFQSMKTGYQGMYNILRFLFSRNEDFKHFVKEDSVILPMEAYRTITDELVYRLRNEARPKYGLCKSYYPIFIKLYDEILRLLNYIISQFYCVVCINEQLTSIPASLYLPETLYKKSNQI